MAHIGGKHWQHLPYVFSLCKPRIQTMDCECMSQVVHARYAANSVCLTNIVTHTKSSKVMQQRNSPNLFAFACQEDKVAACPSVFSRIQIRTEATSDSVAYGQCSFLLSIYAPQCN